MNDSRKGNWHILGAGSQGLLWAAALQEAGIPVCLLLRTPPATPTLAIQVETEGCLRQHEIACAHVSAAGDCRQLLVTVKATDVHAALTALGPARQTLERVVLLQNGIGVEAIARALLPATTALWLGTSTHGSFRRTPTHMVRAGIGEIWLGPGSGQAALSAADQAALASLQRSALAVHWDTDIQRRLWQKLLVNACLNPLTALLDCRNGDLLTLPLARQWMPALAEEAAAVASAEGMPTTPAELLTRVEAIARATAANFNSMQQDFHHGRLTEIAFITGALLLAAERHGLALPHHRELLARIEERRPFASTAAETFANPINRQS